MSGYNKKEYGFGTRCVDIDDAVKYGTNKAFLLYRIRYFVEHNRNKNKNYYEGHYWSWDTYEAIHESLPFIGLSTIKKLMKELESDGIIRIEKLFKDKTDRTNWYTIADWRFDAPSGDSPKNEWDRERMLSSAVTDYALSQSETMHRTKSRLSDSLTLRQSTLYNKTNNKTLKSKLLDFEHVYQQYPRKEGKKRGIEKLKKTVKNKKEYLLLLEAVQNYAMKCQAENIPREYIKHFSTWAGEWQDFIEKPESVKTQSELAKLLRGQNAG